MTDLPTAGLVSDGLFHALSWFYDGTIQHKLMRLHQIRYHVTIWPYDVAWNLFALLALAIALVLHRRTQGDS
jgi:uncharacterized membrane protein